MAKNDLTMTKKPAKILNIAAYKFVELTDKRLIKLQKECESLSKKLNLKGTILLSTEGINLFFAGTQKNIELFWERLVSHIEFFNLTYKASLSERQPFKRMLVKIKDEIIPMDETIRPKQSNGTHLSPK